MNYLDVIIGYVDKTKTYKKTRFNIVESLPEIETIEEMEVYINKHPDVDSTFVIEIRKVQLDVECRVPNAYKYNYYYITKVYYDGCFKETNTNIQQVCILKDEYR